MRNFLYVLSLVSFFCHAQPGHYFLSHFTPSDKKIDHAAFDMVQDANGFMYFATRAGILQFDGTNWNLIPAGGAVYTIEAGQDGTLYWGGSDGFGDLRPGANGAMVARKHPQSADGDFFSIAVGQDVVCFLSDQGLAVLEGDSVKMLKAPEEAGEFTALVEVFGEIFISTEGLGILQLEGHSAFQPARFGAIQIPGVVFSSTIGEQCLIATSDDRLYLCERDFRLKPVLASEQNLLSAGSIVEMRWINERLIAIGTLREGVIFADPLSGHIASLLDYNTGLPDNEVYAMYVDRGKNVWVAHDYGFTRIAPGMPFRNYSSYDGLNGNLLCAETFHEEVYVGTSLGLYRLTSEPVYEEVTWYEPMEAKQNNNAQDQSKTRRKGLFSFLRKKEDKTQRTPQRQEVQQRTSRVLKSERYIYKPVNGITAKVSSLTRLGDRLLASGLGGVFEVDRTRAQQILNLPVRFSFATSDGHLIVSAYDNRIILLTQSGKDWKQVDVLNHIDDLVSQVFEHDGAIWLCGMGTIYQTSIEGDRFSVLRALPIENKDFSHTIGFAWSGRPIFVNRSGFYYFESVDGPLIRIDSLPEPYAYFASSGTVWYSDAHAWKTLGSRTNAGINVLRLLDDIRAINEIENSQDLWVINSTDVLYRLSPQSLRNFAPGFPLMIHSVTQGDRQFDPAGRIAVEQDGGPVLFQVVRPNYLGPASSEYRYFLSGISDDWSDWSVLNNQISIPYLPPGVYTLQVQSRDILGQVHEMTPVRFTVRPVFWKSTWFYAMELTLFALLGWLSLKLSLRYRLVSRVLALLTIILLIEFIQTLAGHSFSTSSPLADFLLQVVIAFLILPVESYLRKVMFRDGKKSKLLAVIDDLDRREKEERQKSASG
ncbi:MAG: triple tyrosine motif-containing protein [Bacteroidota bacterium]|jgi:hypothetical protein|nr:MAG: hypothetical protein DIU61_03410 [Bacteroidota bacterium]